MSADADLRVTAIGNSGSVTITPTGELVFCGFQLSFNRTSGDDKERGLAVLDALREKVICQ